MPIHRARPDSRRGRAILMLCHFVGMVDLVALPVWVGALVQHYGFDLEHAGMIVTAFLLGAVGASLVAAPLFNRLPRARLRRRRLRPSRRWRSSARVAGDRFGAWPLLHLVAGVAAGTALSVTHGTIGRSANPHRLFAIVGTALGVGAVVFYAAVPPAIAAHGGSLLFKVFAGLMALAAWRALGFSAGRQPQPVAAAAAPLPRAAWCAIFGRQLHGAEPGAHVQHAGPDRHHARLRPGTGERPAGGLRPGQPAAGGHRRLPAEAPEPGARGAGGGAAAGRAGGHHHAVHRLTRRTRWPAASTRRC
jgi:hypothetical protein